MARSMSGGFLERASRGTNRFSYPYLCGYRLYFLGFSTVHHELNQGALFSSPSTCSKFSLSQSFVFPTEIALCCPKIFLRTLCFLQGSFPFMVPLLLLSYFYVLYNILEDLLEGTEWWWSMKLASAYICIVVLASIFKHTDNWWIDHYVHWDRG